MKKRVVMFVVALVASIFILGSCQSAGHCPAYSQVDVEQANDNA